MGGAIAMKAQELSKLEAILGHRFRDRGLLEQALTHSSHAREAEAQSEKDTWHDNEQMEFLGDAVLGFVTSEDLFERFPQFREGELSKLRAYLVSEKHLINAAKRLKIGRFLRLGRGEEKSGGRTKTTLQVDALEAVIAAMYMDAGLSKTRKLILDTILGPELRKLSRRKTAVVPVTDFKSALQEITHTLGLAPPSYVVVKEHGPQHNKTFTVEVRIRGNGSPMYSGQCEGSTKKQGEQGAAKAALEFLKQLEKKQGAGSATGHGR